VITPTAPRAGFAPAMTASYCFSGMQHAPGDVYAVYILNLINMYNFDVMFMPPPYNEIGILKNALSFIMIVSS
jgi:hypothetical protein